MTVTQGVWTFVAAVLAIFSVAGFVTAFRAATGWAMDWALRNLVIGILCAAGAVLFFYVAGWLA